MKKKIILICVVAMLFACMLVVSASATTAIPEFTDVIDVSATIDTSKLASVAQNDNLSRVLLRDESGNYATYLTKNITTYNGGYNDDGHFVPYFEALNEATGKNYDVTSIISIEIPEGTLRMSNTYSKTSTWTNVMYVKAPSTLVVCRSNSFQACSKIKVMDFSKANMSDAGKEFFTNNSSVEKIIFPAISTDLGQWSLHGLSALECVYIPGTVETTNSLLNSNTGSGKFVLFYTGTLKEDTQHTSLYTSLNDSTIVELKWDATKSDSYYIDLAKTEGKKYIVYDYSACNAFYDGKHTNVELSPCLSVCSVCNSKIFNHVSEYETFAIEYANGFMAEGKKITTCLSEGCMYSAEENTLPLFTCLGYSTPTDGREGLAIGFTLDKEALNEYKAATGKAFNYGVFAVLKDRLGDNDVFAQDGTAIEGSINADITSYEFVAFELRIEGFIDEYKDVKLAMGAYVAETDGETTKYSYLQAGTPAENEKYCFVSYNDIANSPLN